VPIVIRNEEGVIMPIKLSERGVGTENVGMRVDMDVDDISEEHFGGFSERVPSHAGELVGSSISL